MTLKLKSFGFLHGEPKADIIYDARGLPNPHRYMELRHLCGWDKKVREDLERFSKYRLFVYDIIAEITEKKPSTVAVGCFAGRHRSVATVCAVAEHFSNLGWQVEVDHRDALEGKGEKLQKELFDTPIDKTDKTGYNSFCEDLYWNEIV